jgi:hypothetical protein
MKRIAGFGLAAVFLLAANVLTQESLLAQAARSDASPQPQGRPATWQDERGAMLKLVIERGRKHVQAVRMMAEIGTTRPVDVNAAATWLADLEKQVEADAARAASRVEPTRPEHATLRIRFAEAMNAVDLAEVRFDNGMITTAAMNASLTAAAAVFLGPPVK